MTIFHCAQKSQEWWRVRRGIPTASEFDRILSPVKMTPSQSQNPYIDELIADLFDQMYSLEPDSGFVSKAMQDGIDWEPAARRWYAFDQNVDVNEVGFVVSDCGRFGASPDGLIGDDGGLEIKRPMLKTHIKWLREGVLPNEHKCQVHGELLATKRKWWDFLSYSPSDELPNLIVRVYPDSFTRALNDELETFLGKYQSALNKIRRKVIRPADEAIA